MPPIKVRSGKRFWKYLSVFATLNYAALLAIRTFSSVEKLVYGPRVVLVLLRAAGSAKPLAPQTRASN